MNEEVRSVVATRLSQKQMSRADLARVIGKTPQAISRALNGGKDGGGQVPGIWQDILNALDLELTARPREAALGEREGQ